MARRKLRQIRRTGVALGLEKAQERLACLASPVLGADGDVIGSVSLCVRPDDLHTRRQQLIATVREAARRPRRSAGADNAMGW
ncbi:IclR family transcriptional regulator domain-containing protein [Streptomyces sichuanensis]|uniref:IclR family transcriptional regulator domain-containing protein n=1 Tax=Streptomyces sichuanensis TaxID=2871810 RepID=UPI0027DF4E09|nr:IclR family transcriptional regulator C-terminal domain-containing protein [Streptomyces sichuanensis]